MGRKKDKSPPSKGDTHQKAYTFKKGIDFKLIPRGLCPEVVHYMDALGLVTVIAIILFARLGVRLLVRYYQTDKEDKDSNKQ